MEWAPQDHQNKKHANTEFKLKNGKTLLVHAHWLKPYFESISAKTDFKDTNTLTTVPNNANEREIYCTRLSTHSVPIYLWN
jgi:hypothetical protein